MKNSLINQIEALKSDGKKALAILLDPDHMSEEGLIKIAESVNDFDVDFILVGGSLVSGNEIHDQVPILRQYTEKPVILFPGSLNQISPDADGILFLSLISGRNADLLIGRHVEAAPLLYQMNVEVLPTGYMLIESGNYTTAHYMSNTLPIPHDKPQIAVSTALAGQMLGLRLIYMDGGSGAKRTISLPMIREVSQRIQIPLIIGGGIRDAETAKNIWEAGADLIVVGNALENGENPDLIQEIAEVKAKIAQKSFEV